MKAQTANGWGSDRLKDLTEINAISLGSTTPGDFEFNYLEISNVDYFGVVSEDDIALVQFEDAPSRARRRVRVSDVLVSSVRPNLQAIAHIRNSIGDDLICSTGFNVVTPNQTRVTDRFLYYFLLSEGNRQHFEAVAKGVGYPALDNKDFDATIVPLPPPPEQKRIAAYLDASCAAVNQAVEAKQKQHEILDTFRKSIIQKALTQGRNPDVEMKDSGVPYLGRVPVHWGVSKMKRLLTEPLSYGLNEPGTDENPDNPRYIRITDFGKDGNLRPNTFRSLPIDVASGAPLVEGDILLARSGATVGKSFFFADYEGAACYAGYLVKARAAQHLILPQFLYLYTRSLSYETWKDQIFTQATIQNISATKYAYLEVPVPGIDEQKKILNFLEGELKRIGLLNSNNQTQIATLIAYRKSLIHECVTGKRRITDADVARVETHA